MKLPIYQIDAFADRIFSGNPAAIVPLDSWLPDATMQSIAAENNLAETAFFVRDKDDTKGSWGLRWFTPEVEVDLCGHATLASAFVLFEHLGVTADVIGFDTRSGRPQREARGRPVGDGFSRAPGQADSRIAQPHQSARRATARSADGARHDGGVRERRSGEGAEARHGGNQQTRYFCRDSSPRRGKGGIDFVSRFFAPAKGVPEDPVTGSAHCTLVPYWSKLLEKTELRARQGLGARRRLAVPRSRRPRRDGGASGAVSRGDDHCVSGASRADQYSSP